MTKGKSSGSSRSRTVSKIRDRVILTEWYFEERRASLEHRAVLTDRIESARRVVASLPEGSHQARTWLELLVVWEAELENLG